LVVYGPMIVTEPVVSPIQLRLSGGIKYDRQLYLPLRQGLH